MALDRSPESFSPQMESTSLFLWFQPVTPGVGPVFPISEKKNSEVGLLCSYVPTCDPRGGISFDPKGII